MQAEVLRQFEILKDGIRLDTPLVADFFEEVTPLQEYALALRRYQALPQQREHQKELKEAIRSRLEEVFDEAEIKTGNIDWDSDWKVNIVDHHNLLNHPILLATNIIGNIHQLPTTHPKGIVVLSDSGVPMNNFFHKRGLRFYGNQLNLFSHRERHLISYAAPKKESFPLLKTAAPYNLPASALEFLKEMERRLSTTGRDSRIRSFSDQVMRINYTLWKDIFSQDLRRHIPDLFYVANEEIAVSLLKKYLRDPNHLFSRILFHPKTRDLFIENFVDIAGCWDKDRKRGSLFFWGLNESGEAVSLTIQNNKLVSKDANQSIQVTLETNAIVKSLEKKEIYPGMFLSYGISIFYCGTRPLVGYGSMNYLTKMKDAWIKTMKQIDQSEVSLIKHISTTGFVGGLKATFARTPEGYKDLFALDVIHAGGLNKEYLDHLRNIPFNALLLPALIDIYDSYMRPEHKRKIDITSSDLIGEELRNIVFKD